MAIHNLSDLGSIKPHRVFSELDSHGLTLGLPRLENEKNAEYKQRLLDVFVHRASSSYLGLIYGITRELGLKLRKELTIVPNDIAANPSASIVFKDTRCCIYQDHYNEAVLFEVDRSTLSGGAYTIAELISWIGQQKSDGQPIFTVTAFPGIDLSQRAMTIYQQDSTLTQAKEFLTGRGRTINLQNTGIIEGSEYINSRTLKKKRTSAGELLPSEYRINYESGLFECGDELDGLAYIAYKYRNDELVVMSSPVIINNLQSTEFKKKMFEQVLQEDGKYENGIPTKFGADVINELLSVFPTTYKA
jgi:hypothetical protein